jgi:hypothetical protein
MTDDATRVDNTPARDAPVRNALPPSAYIVRAGIAAFAQNCIDVLNDGDTPTVMRAEWAHIRDEFIRLSTTSEVPRG